MNTSRYVEKKYIGSGGMAKVYKAFDETLRRHVAIKEMTEQFRDNADIRNLFVNEARKMASVRHQNVVQVYDVDDSGDIPIIIMEYMGGGSLGTRIGTGSLPAEEVLSIVRQIVMGLQAIHNAGLVHRDVKPENILEESGVYKITDFGVAMSGEEDALPFVTNKYAAPEVLIEPDKIGPSSDIYSVGIMAIELLLGPYQFELAVREAIETDNKLQLPALKDSVQAFWQQWIASTVELPPLNTIDEAIPASVSNLLARVTKRSRDERILDCRSLLSELDDVIKSGKQRSSAPTEYSAKMKRRLDDSKSTSQKADQPKAKKPLWLKLTVGVGVLLVVATLALFIIPTGPPRYYFDVKTDPAGAVVSINGEQLDIEPTPTRLIASWGDTLFLQVEGREPLELQLVEGMDGISSTDELFVLEVAFPGAFAIRNSAEASEIMRDRLPQAWAVAASIDGAGTPAEDSQAIDIEIGSDLRFKVESEKAALLTMIHLGSDNYLTSIYPNPADYSPSVKAQTALSVGADIGLIAQEPLGSEWFVFVFSESRVAPQANVGGLAVDDWATAYKIDGNGSPGETFILSLLEAVDNGNASATLIEIAVIAKGSSK